LQYIGRIDVKANNFADLDKVKKSFLRNRAVYSTFGTHLELIYLDYRMHQINIDTLETTLPH
jgi:hypothetical protein